MRSLSGIAIQTSVVLGALAGCAAPVDPPGSPADEAVRHDDLTADASSQSGASVYFGITADVRKCASPMCGGWFVTRLNRTTTRCHDGRLAASCYTPVLDWSVSGLSEGQQGAMLDASGREAGSSGFYAIVRGRLAATNDSTPRPDMGRLVIDQAWVAEGDVPSDGVFVQVQDNGRRCFAAPCLSMTETVLNKRQERDIAEIDWAPANLTESQVGECLDAMSGPDGLMVAGHRYTMYGEAGEAPARTATAAYYRLTPR